MMCQDLRRPNLAKQEGRMAASLSRPTIGVLTASVACKTQQTS